MQQVIQLYSDNAKVFAEKFDKAQTAELIKPFQSFLPQASGRILDIGAGSGRDALWFAEQGYEVTAVEPALNLRKIGQTKCQDQAISWVDDSLPTLSVLSKKSDRYDFIWLNAVWMFLLPKDRAAALQTLASLLAAGGHIGLAVQSNFLERQDIKHLTTEEEFLQLAEISQLNLVHFESVPDSRGHVAQGWQVVIFSLK